MWYLKVFLLLVFILAILLFALANGGQLVLIRWWIPGSAGSTVDLALALFGAYFVGVLTFFIISAFRELRLRSRCSRLQREVERMRGELDALRTAPFDGPVGDRPPSPEEAAMPAATPGV